MLKWKNKVKHKNWGGKCVQNDSFNSQYLVFRAFDIPKCQMPADLRRKQQGGILTTKSSGPPIFGFRKNVAKLKQLF